MWHRTLLLPEEEYPVGGGGGSLPKNEEYPKSVGGGSLPKKIKGTRRGRW